MARNAELNREVALKFLKPEPSRDADSRRRFLQEAEVTGRLEHPGVVPIYALGTDAAGAPCYAMRFIRGETLQDAIDAFHAAEKPGRDPSERSLALRELLNRFVSICNTMAYAHSRGILHRDLKPRNVMLGKYDETLVVDWGLAKPFERDEAARSVGEETLTPSSGSGESGSDTPTVGVVGTPAYMSPEQAEARWDLVGPASDLFGLGAILYAILTGQAPYRGRKVGEILEKVKRCEFPAPRQIKPGVPRALEAICLKAMARRPEDRYATALDLAADVRRWLADEPVPAYRAAGRRGRPMDAAASDPGRGDPCPAGHVRSWRCRGAALVDRERHRTLQHARRRFRSERLPSASESEPTTSGRWPTPPRTRRTRRTRRVRRTAQASLATARMLRSAANELGPQPQALEHVRTASRARHQAHGVLQASDPAAVATREELRQWDERAETIRTEAAYWLTNFEIRRVREIAVPQDREDYWMGIPAVAIREDGGRIAVAHEAHRGGRRRPFLWSSTRKETCVSRRPSRRLTATRFGDSVAPSIRLRFAGSERVECALPDAIPHILHLADGRVESSSLETKVAIPRYEGVIGGNLWGGQQSPDRGAPVPAPIEASNASYVLNWLPRTVSVKARQPDAEPRTIWQPMAYDDECKYAGFLSEPRGMLLVIGPRVPHPIPMGSLAANRLSLLFPRGLSFRASPARSSESGRDCNWPMH